MSADRRSLKSGVAPAGDAFFMPVAPPAFLLLLFALSAPFWLAAAFITPTLPGRLPFSALTALLPLAAALILTARRDGKAGVARFVRRLADARGLLRPRTLALALLLFPAIVALAHGAAWFLSPAAVAPSSVALLLLLVPVFLVFAIGEEAGWSGVMTEPLVDRFGSVVGGLMLGGLWAAWHVVPFVQTGQSAGWIAWQSAYTVLARMILVWLYVRSGRSIAATALAHAAYNLAWIAVPTNGSHYDPAAMAIVTAIAAAILFARRPARN